MKGYPLLIIGLMSLLVGLYLLVDAAGVPVLTDPAPLMHRSGTLAGVVGVGLLAGGLAAGVAAAVMIVVAVRKEDFGRGAAAPPARDSTPMAA